MTSEFELIKILTANIPSKGKNLVRGIGDDCAVIEKDTKNYWLVTTDALVENIHFRRRWTDLKTLGRKALSSNLSDIAAMGGIPRFYLVSIGLPEKNTKKMAISIYKGMREVAHRHGVILIGGDTVASPKSIVISITVIGEVEKNFCLFRSGAKSGDAIYVTGELGHSALGLKYLERNLKSAFIKNHSNPSPRIDESRIIAKTKMATSMIDVSDGLLADLTHIADESQVGFEINTSNISISNHFKKTSKLVQKDPLVLYLSGGEDYELLFTIDSCYINRFERLIKKRKITRIGTILTDKNKRIVRGENGKIIKIKNKGYDHFVK